MFGDTVLAPASGVILAIWSNDTGLGPESSLLIEHSSKDLDLADAQVSHLSEFNHLSMGDISHLQKGDRIERGQPIGIVRYPGGNPQFTAEVHWEVYEIVTTQLSQTSWSVPNSKSTSWWNEAAILIDPLYLLSQGQEDLETKQIHIEPFRTKSDKEYSGFTYHLRCA